MKILFDARHILHVYSGLARYTYSILITLLMQKDGHEVEILLDSNSDYQENSLYLDIVKHIDKENIFYIDAPLFGLKHHINTALYVNSSNCDLYFYPHFDAPLFVRKKTKFAVFDLLPLVVENYVLKNKILKQIYFKYMIKVNLFKTNNSCVTISKSTKNDIKKYIGERCLSKVDVVYGDRFDITIKEKETNKYMDNLPKKFLLYIGDRRPHKNLKSMIDIFNLLKFQHGYSGAFVIAGSEKNYDLDLEKYVENNHDVYLIGKVSDLELETLYKAMDALFFMTQYEGFGLPILEAAKYNKKIITSDSSSLKEISPNNALLLQLHENPSKLALQMHQYLSEAIAIDNDIYLSKFSWNKSIEQIFLNEEMA